MDTDVVIIGGGSAGLQAALTLGRMRFDVVVVDAGRPSNAPAHAIGGLLGAHELAPLEFLANGREELAELPSVTLVQGEATRLDADLTVTLADETALTARSVVLATGADYQVPDVPGIAELWGKSVIHCPFCHGWEARDARIGVFVEERAAHVMPMLRRLSADVRVFDALVAVRSLDGALTAVVLPDGTEVPRDVLFVAAPPKPRDSAFAHLPLERNGDAGLLAIDAFGRTSVTGVSAAGDLVTEAPAVVQALATGQRAAVGVTRDLALEQHDAGGDQPQRPGDVGRRGELLGDRPAA
jgi:thioredoxin reductase